MPSATTKKQHLDLAYAAVQGTDAEAALAALARIEKDGTSDAIRPLLKALVKTADGPIQQRITTMLFAVKAANATAVLIETLDEPELAPVRNTIIATFWNAGLDVRDYLDLFIDLAVEGDAATCFECLTVIENQEIWPEKAARLALAKVEKAVSAEADAYKRAMLQDLSAALAYRLGKEN